MDYPTIELLKSVNQNLEEILKVLKELGKALPYEFHDDASE